MARRRTHPHAARTHLITVRVTPDIHARLTAEAAQIGTSVAGIAECYISKGSIRVEASAAPPPLPPALIAELKRIGNNLNQIAHAANAGLPPDTMRTITTMHDLIRLMLNHELTQQRVKSVRHLVPVR